MTSQKVKERNLFQETVRATDRELPEGQESFPNQEEGSTEHFVMDLQVTFTNMKEESGEGDHRRLANTPAS